MFMMENNILIDAIVAASLCPCKDFRKVYDYHRLQRDETGTVSSYFIICNFLFLSYPNAVPETVMLKT